MLRACFPCTTNHTSNNPSMAASATGNITTKGSKATLTAQQKQKIIERFRKELDEREKQFQADIDNEIKLLRLKFNNRLNKILRKFWDVKIGDILNVERELKSNFPLTLLNVIKQLDAVRRENATGVENMTTTETPGRN
jgi:hypothetical protein